MHASITLSYAKVICYGLMLLGTLFVHGLAACRARCPSLLVSCSIKGPVSHTQAARGVSCSPDRDFQASHPVCEWLARCASTVHRHHECYLFSTGAHSMVKLWSVCHHAFSMEQVVYDGLRPGSSPSPAVRLLQICHRCRSCTLYQVSTLWG